MYERDVYEFRARHEVLIHFEMIGQRCPLYFYRVLIGSIFSGELSHIGQGSNSVWKHSFKCSQGSDYIRDPTSLKYFSSHSLKEVTCHMYHVTPTSWAQLNSLS